jgi:hypothetical protein
MGSFFSYCANGAVKEEIGYLPKENSPKTNVGKFCFLFPDIKQLLFF